MSELSVIKDRLREETSQFFKQSGLEIPEGWQINIDPGGNQTVDARVIGSEVYLYPEKLEDLDLEEGQKWFGKSVHETSHLKYKQNFSIPEIDEIDNVTENKKQKIIDREIQAKEKCLEKNDLENVEDLYWAVFFDEKDYSVAEDVLSSNLEARITAMSEIFSEDAMELYIKKMGIMGIGETQAIAIENKYNEKEFSSLDDKSISPNNLFYYALRSNDMLNTDISSIGNYLDNHGYANFLKLSEEELIDRFYKEENLLAI